ncbi:Uncharacterised protein [Mycoplasmopsis maculosa]|uniref:Lipoprotein n=1 Tax=Mycoplasmopsis maculosa TaxID=114885 RepID=A0A449B4E3_9BACT|nr:hypothetical protein [Mycoplasmopsis maculosa]VEU75474.1 Uncharacterised protein [Mycoplasmopsis maculosa]
MKFKFLTPILTIAPLAAVSCVNPFKNTKELNDSFYIEKNNDFYNKSTSGLIKKLDLVLQNKINNLTQEKGTESYNKAVNELKENYNLQLKIFNNFYETSKESSSIFKQDKYYLEYHYKSSLNYWYNSFDSNKKIVKNYIEFDKEYFEAFVSWMFEGTPYNHLLSSEKYYSKDKIKFNFISKKIDLVTNFYNDEKTTEIEGNIPNIYFNELISETSFRNSQTIENLTKTYKNILVNLAKQINAIDLNNEHSFLKVFQPIYLILDSKSDKNPYITSSFTESISKQELTLFLRSLRNKLGENKFDEFKLNPLEFVKNNLSAINPSYYLNINNNKTYDELIVNKTAEEVSKINDDLVEKMLNNTTNPLFQNVLVSKLNNHGAIGKTGLSLLISNVLYYLYPKHVQLIEFKDENNNTKVLIEVKVNDQYVLLDPLKDLTEIFSLENSNLSDIFLNMRSNQNDYIKANKNLKEGIKTLEKSGLNLENEADKQRFNSEKAALELAQTQAKEEYLTSYTKYKEAYQKMLQKIENKENISVSIYKNKEELKNAKLSFNSDAYEIKSIGKNWVE